MGLHHERDAVLVKVTKIQDDNFTENDVCGRAYILSFFASEQKVLVFTLISKDLFYFYYLSHLSDTRFSFVS